MNSKFKKNISVLVFILSIVTMYFGVRYVTQLQELAKKTGASGDVSLYFEPNEITTDINSTISPVLRVNPFTNSVTAVELYLTFDSTKLSIQSVTASASFPTILENSIIDNNTGNASIILGVTPNNSVTTISDVLDIVVQSKTTYGDAIISVAQTSQVSALGVDTSVLGNFGTMMIHIVDPNVTATPTASPTAGATATATATSDPTASPTAEPTATVTSTSTATATATATVIATATATSQPEYVAGEPNSCGGTCGSNYNCKANFYCYNGLCRNPICKDDSDCDCNGVGSVQSSTVVSASRPTITSSNTVAPSVFNDEVVATYKSASDLNVKSPFIGGKGGQDEITTTEELQDSGVSNFYKYLIIAVASGLVVTISIVLVYRNKNNSVI